MKSAVITAMALCACLLAAAGPAGAQPASPSPPTIVTTGEGVVKRAPDRAWVAIAAESRARTAPDAQRLNTEAMTAVLDRIKATGVAGDAVRTSAYTLQPDFEYQNGRQNLRGYVSRNQVEVRVDAIAKLGEVLAAAVATGATSVGGVRFDLKDRDAAEADALRLAVRDARRRADAAASGAGVRILQVLRIDEQRDVDIVRPMGMAEMVTMRAEAPAPVPVEKGEIEIRSRVTLAVLIQ